MPRSIKRPILGTFVWYYPSVPPTNPSAALVVNAPSNVAFGLYVFDRTNGAPTYVASVPFHDGTRPTSGAWCTFIRVNEPATGQWPWRADSSMPLGPAGVMPASMQEMSQEASHGAKDEEEEDVQGALRQGQAQRARTTGGTAPAHRGTTVDQA